MTKTRTFVNLSLLLFLSGCVPVTVNDGTGTVPGTYSYFQGELTATYDQPLEKVWLKTIDAVRSLKLSIISKEMDSLGGVIRASRVDSTAVKLRLKPAGVDRTTIGVRVGTFGNKDQAERVHAAIRQQVGAAESR